MIDIDRILLATDFSGDSVLALELAKETARRFDAEVIVLHVDEGPEAAPLSAAAALRRDEARLKLQHVREELAEQHIRASTLLRPGDPAREILRIATSRTVGMIVIATHGWTRSSNLLLGSVADRVLRHAPLPVLTVRHPDRQVPAPAGGAVFPAC